MGIIKHNLFDYTDDRFLFSDLEN